MLVGARVTRLPSAIFRGSALAAAVMIFPASPPATEPIRGFSPAAAERERALESLFSQRLSRDSTGAFFRTLTAEPHAAGSARNKYLADWLADKWRAYGLDDVKLHRYDVYLPQPKEVAVTMTAPVRFEATLREDPIAADPDTKLDPGPTYLGK